MKKTIFALLLLGCSTAANAVVLTFDDHPNAAQNNYGGVGAYGGFNFSSNLDWVDTVGSVWNFGAVSGDFTLLNNYGGVGIITAMGGSDFTFDGMWSRVWSTVDSRQGSIRGFNNGIEIWTSGITIDTDWAYFSGVAGSIDELRLDLGNYFLVDNLALNESARIAEPASLALLGIGLVGLGAMRRRKTA